MKVNRSSSSIAATRVVESAGVRRAIRAPLLLERGRGRRTSARARRRGERARPLDLGALVVVLAEHADRLGVLEHVVDVLRRAVRVDRRADRADVREREVEQRPLDASSGRGSRTRRPCERRGRAGRSRSSSTRSAASCPGDLAPTVVRRRRYARSRCALAIASRQRRGMVRFPAIRYRNVVAKGSPRSRAKPGGPASLDSGGSCASPGTVRSASGSLASPSGSRPRRNRLRVSRTCRSGCCTASA